MNSNVSREIFTDPVKRKTLNYEIKPSLSLVPLFTKIENGSILEEQLEAASMSTNCNSQMRAVGVPADAGFTSVRIGGHTENTELTSKEQELVDASVQWQSRLSATSLRLKHYISHKNLIAIRSLSRVGKKGEHQLIGTLNDVFLQVDPWSSDDDDYINDTVKEICDQAILEEQLEFDAHTDEMADVDISWLTWARSSSDGYIKELSDQYDQASKYLKTERRRVKKERERVKREQAPKIEVPAVYPAPLPPLNIPHDKAPSTEAASEFPDSPDADAIAELRQAELPAEYLTGFEPIDVPLLPPDWRSTRVDRTTGTYIDAKGVETMSIATGVIGKISDFLQTAPCGDVALLLMD